MRNGKTRKGFITILSLEIVTIFSTVGLSFLIRSLAESQLGERHAKRQTAFYLAEAGVDRTVKELRADAGWAGTGGYAAPPAAGGGYEVSVADLGPTLRMVTSTGSFPSNVESAPGYQRRRVQVHLSFQPKHTWEHALFTAGNIHLSSQVKIDSYDSTLGAYNVSGNIGSNGDLGSNTAAAQTIFAEGNTVIAGSVWAGPGAVVDATPPYNDPNSAIITTGTVTVTGTRGAATVPKTLNCQTFPIGTASGALDTTTNTTLAGGTYRFTYLHLGPGANLELDGDVTIYVEQYVFLDNNASIGGHVCDGCILTMYVDGSNAASPQENAIELSANAWMAADDNPMHLNLIVTSDTAVAHEVDLDSKAAIFGTVDAPCSRLDMNGGGDIYGAAIARTADMNAKAGIHYDVTLGANAPKGAQAVHVVSWRDLN